MTSKQMENINVKQAPGPGALKTLFYLSRLIWRQDVLDLMNELHNQYGSIVQIQKYTLMNGIHASKFMMSTGVEKFQRQPIAEAGPPSLASKDGAEHKQHRKLVMNAFRPKQLEKYVASMSPLMKKRIASWDGEIDLFAEMKELTLDIVLRTMLGIEPGTDLHQRYMKGYWLLLNRGKESNKTNSTYQQAMRAKDVIWDVIKQLIQERRNNPSDDALTSLLEAYENSEDKLDEETFIGYAYMLTEFGEGDLANMLTYAVAALVFYPHIMDRVSQEVNSSSLDTSHIFNQMPYTLNLVREVERLYPPVPYVARYAMETVQYNDFFIPKGSIAVANIYLSHRCEQNFNDPLVFDPSRYERSVGEMNNPNSLIGFGVGNHMCVAKQYAQIQVCLFLQHLLQSSSLMSIKGLGVIPDMNYKGATSPSRTINIQVTKNSIHQEDIK
ncbi:cytochrome P450 [Paenibacillus amylolyticus]|uniref:cytochrome P450 n=1 Tax=Paenibacillus amylolyticus TaxID=1451 RepID=UPI003EBD3B22